MQTLTRPITSAEFRAMDFDEAGDDKLIFELIDGQIVSRSYPISSHQRCLSDLLICIGQYVDTTKTGEVLMALFPVVLDDVNFVLPDIMFLKESNRQIIRQEGIYGVPDLVVEIISPSSIKTDRTTKFKLYERMGVAEYWIVDIKNQSVEVYGQQPAHDTLSGYELVSFAVEKDAITSTVLTGLTVDISALFA
jgi:Uma2 family endonuclease